MLPFFPPPYPDEMLYSILARYHIRSRHDSIKNTVIELFGSQTASAVIDLPNRLQMLCDKLTEGSMITPEIIIQEHTLFPFYRPFLPPDRATAIERAMKHSTKGNIHMMIGLMASTITAPAYLRYCRMCVQDDTEKFGQPYWHRTHQVFGVYVCPHHHVPLTESSVAATSRQNKQVFVALNSLTREGQPMNMATRNQHANNVADAVYWVLNNEPPSIGPPTIRARYIQALQQRGLATVKGRVRQQELVRRFATHYGTSFLELMDSPVNPDATDYWFTKIVREPRSVTHPLRHVLFMGFLGMTPAQFFDTQQRFQPFGAGPWPCLNPAALHYREPHVVRCVITRDYDTGAPVGTFHCMCEFVYSRKGLDTDESDKYRIGRIKAFGSVWQSKLRDLVSRGKTTSEIAKLLHVDSITVKRQIEKLDNDPIEPRETTMPRDLEEKRNRWLKAMKDHQLASKTELRRMYPEVYAWLYRHDRNWLHENSPILRGPSKYRDTRVDWAARDVEFLKRIEHAVEVIKGLEKPVRLSVNSIGRQIGEQMVLQKHLDKLPKTHDFLKRILESVEDFQVRRVHQVAERLRANAVQVQEWRLVREAGLRPGYSFRVAEQLRVECGRKDKG